MEFFDAISSLQLAQTNNLSTESRDQLLSKLRRTGLKLVSTNPSEWNKFVVKPLWLAPSPRAPLAEILADDIQTNLDYEIDNQLEDGSWSPTWSWGMDFPEAWKMAENE